MLLAQNDSTSENRRVNDSASILLVQAHYVTPCPCRVLAELHNMHRESEPCIFQYQLIAIPIGPVPDNLSHDTLDGIWIYYNHRC